MLSTSEETLEKVMTEYQENIPEALNRRFPDWLSKTEAIKRQLERKQLPSTPLFPSCKFWYMHANMYRWINSAF
jgi:hypothetical protein